MTSPRPVGLVRQGAGKAAGSTALLPAVISLLTSAAFAGGLMNWDRIQGNWKQLKGRVREQWGELTDDDLDRIAGRREQLIGRIQESYGLTKDEAEKRVREWESRDLS